MSLRPHRLCTCGQVVPHGTTCACQIAAKRQRDRRHDARRPSSHRRGYTAEWRKQSREWLAYHPTCTMCGGQASLVDHVRPHRGDPNLFWAWQNWQSLCTPCHNSRKQRIERAAELKAGGPKVIGEQSGLDRIVFAPDKNHDQAEERPDCGNRGAERIEQRSITLLEQCFDMQHVKQAKNCGHYDG